MFSRSLFFSLLLIFTLHWWPLAFLVLSLLLQNFHVVLPTKNVSFVFDLIEESYLKSNTKFCLLCMPKLRKL